MSRPAPHQGYGGLPAAPAPTARWHPTKPASQAIPAARLPGRLPGRDQTSPPRQENEIEATNEYLFAVTAHTIYWDCKDTSLFMAKELWG